MKNNQTIQLHLDQQIVAGIGEEMQPTMDIHLGGESFTPEDRSRTSSSNGSTRRTSCSPPVCDCGAP